MTQPRQDQPLTPFSQKPKPNPLILEYHNSQDDIDRPATLLMRIAATLFSLIFATWPAYQWFFTERPSDPSYLPAISVSIAGSLFCLLIAAGVFGKQTRTCA